MEANIMISMSKSKQLNLFDEFLELNYLSKKQPTGFLNLLLENFDLQSFISQSFTEHYYSILGRNRNYKLSARLFTLTIMEILHVTVNSLLYLFFHFFFRYSRILWLLRLSALRIIFQ